MTDELFVGYTSGGQGNLTISAGGLVTSNKGSISYNGPSTSLVTVTGAGSTWNSATYINVGSYGGNARLYVYNGGTVNSATGEIGLSGYGDTTIRDAGSVWTISGNLNVANGGSSTGYLNVYNNGRVNVGGTSGTGTITLAQGGGSGILFIGDSEYSPSGGIINAATITTGAGTGQIRFDTDTTKASPYYLTRDGLSGGTPVIITGPTEVRNQYGYNVLTGANTYTGTTTISGGTLVYGAGGAFGTSSVVINGGNLGVASGLTFSNSFSFGGSGGTLSGNGTFTSPLTLGTGVTLSPGNSPGTLSFASGLTLTGTGGATTIEISGATDNPGVSADLVAVTGTLDLTGLSNYTLNVISLLPDNVTPGAVSGLGSSASWTIFTSTTLTGFDTADFTIASSGFVTPGTFSLSSSGNNLVLNFTAVPEPSTYALMLAGLGLSGLAAWRKSSRA